MKKWICVAVGIIGFIGAIAGLYFYVKKTMSKIGKAIDDTFDVEQRDDQNGHCVSYHSNEQVVVPLGGTVPLKFKDYEWYLKHINTVNMFDGDDGR